MDIWASLNQGKNKDKTFINLVSMVIVINLFAMLS